MSSTVVASLELRYGEIRQRFFDEQMPIEMEGLIPSQLFTARMQGINQHLARCTTLRDYTSILRTCIFFCFVGFCVLFVVLAARFSAIMLWCVSFLGLSCMFVSLLLTYRYPRYERYVQSKLADFSSQDESIQLIWTSSRNHEQPLFAFNWSRSGAEIPWKIVVSLVNKQGAESHFLPAYSGSLDFLARFRGDGVEGRESQSTMEEGGVRRPPSYKSTV
ncbi:hypothetical protein HDU98_007608 [Podochytrium sp. JEL0797]|nr:hypothetical protein HDU98_007608 [Podochytrium sp. JEL0797]